MKTQSMPLNIGELLNKGYVVRSPNVNILKLQNFSVRFLVLKLHVQMNAILEKGTSLILDCNRKDLFSKRILINHKFIMVIQKIDLPKLFVFVIKTDHMHTNCLQIEDVMLNLIEKHLSWIMF